MTFGISAVNRGIMYPLGLAECSISVLNHGDISTDAGTNTAAWEGSVSVKGAEKSWWLCYQRVYSIAQNLVSLNTKTQKSSC